MEFYKVSSFADLQQGSYGILEPQTNSDTLNGFGKNALCVVPALSYDKKGYRLGFGKGYYDRFLAKHPHSYKAGIATPAQISKEPLEQKDTDVQMNVVIPCREKY